MHGVHPISKLAAFGKSCQKLVHPSFTPMTPRFCPPSRSPNVLSHSTLLALISVCLPCWILPAEAQTLPPKDLRAAAVKDLNTPRVFPAVANKAAWTQMASDLRENILVSCGLWPMPERGQVQFRISDCVERDGYTVEKVAIKTWPGFYLAGNLYRPRGKGAGPFPAILNPHGHWRNGRMADEETGSIAGRCISFARQGMIAFSYDMTGYNDTQQVPHTYASDPTNQLWSVSLMGLQTWNSVRALDFLAALPDSDVKRLACTGESGGGTQTFMLGAIDDRLAAQAPIVMVSHSMQGGCLCENAPGLRVKHSNMEIAALPAPRPQVIVAATGDWTKAMPWVEGPAIESIYRLLGARDSFAHARFDFPHNYNRTTRETVYGWFNHWLQSTPSPDPISEPPFRKERDADLLVWGGGKPPSDALNEAGLASSWVNYAKGSLAALRPHDPAGSAKMKSVLQPHWRHALQLDASDVKVLVELGTRREQGGFSETELVFGRAGAGDRLAATLLAPAQPRTKTTVVLVHPDGRRAFRDTLGLPRGAASAFLNEGLTVLLVDVFQTGENWDAGAVSKRNAFKNYFTVYNRTDMQERVQDLVTACRTARQISSGHQAMLCGLGTAGWWTLLAAPAADATMAEASGLNPSDDRALLAPEYFAPGLNRFGGFAGAAALAAPRPLLVHGLGDGLNTGWIEDAFTAAGAGRSLNLQKQKSSDPMLAAWVRNHLR